MSVISREYIENATDCSLTYMIEITNFPKKLSKAKRGEMVETEVFTISWSSFKVGVYLVGSDEHSQDHVSVYLYNQSNWLLKADYRISVKKQFLWSSCVKVFEGRDQERHAWGQPRCIPHSRCKESDLLTPSGSLLIEIEVNLVDELMTGGNMERRREYRDLKESLRDIQKLLRSFLLTSSEQCVCHNNNNPVSRTEETTDRDLIHLTE